MAAGEGRARRQGGAARGGRIVRTTSDNEDSGGATGWTIANATEWANQDTPGAGMTWTTDSTARIAIRVNGSTAQTAPSAPPA